ncbi:MAG: sigma-70 family RNA polymerase sigma factor, partial [Pseudonocardiaceae bacterium]
MTSTDESEEWAAPKGADYGHAALFAELAGLDQSDPRRAQLRDRLVAAHLPLARHIARRFSHRGEPQDDLEQVACVGLIHAVDRFEPDRGSDFLSFAVPTITGEVRRYFRDHAWAMRVPRRLKDLHVAIGSAMSILSQQHGRAPTASELAEYLDLPREQVLEGLGAASGYRTSSLD